MLRCPAEGCDYAAKSDRGLTHHVMKCPHTAAGLTSVADNIADRDVGQWQAKRRRISSPQRPEIAVPGPGEGMDVDLEVCQQIKNPAEKRSYQLSAR